MPPKVFISHATEDKDRFVIEFTKKLRDIGIEAWLDHWEMLPGDSLVEKIFDEGLKNANAIIVILSEFSVNKPWVKEELNAGIIAKISKGTKIIPVVLDNCEVPESLKSTLWEKINDINNYQVNLDRIVASIFEHDMKPPLGPPPAYTKEGIIEMSGLTKIDNLILKVSCENELMKDQNIVEPTELFGEASEFNMPLGEVSDSLEILNQQGFIELHSHLGPGPYRFSITLFGMEEYAKNYIQDYQDIIREVIGAIVNHTLHDSGSIAEHTNQKARLITHILDLLENKRHVQLSRTLGGGVRIFNVSPSLRRTLL